MNTTFCISPLDGRYYNKLKHLSKYFSEYSLMESRCKIELLYLKSLNETFLFSRLSTNEIDNINNLLNNFSIPDFKCIKEIEKVSNHDVKACEIFLREKLKLSNPNMIHFGLTSEDINNLAYTVLFKTYLENEHIPLIKKLLETLSTLALEWKCIAFPSRTHGQKASPSTAGKEVSVYINRILKQYKKLKNFKFSAKLNGAVGNYSAMLSAFPDYDWMEFSYKFINELNLSPNISTTQIEDHDCWAEYFNINRQINNIILDLDIDFWQYISQGLFIEKSMLNEVGSSTMPHKINPINFENSEGNLMLSNSLFVLMSDKLCRSRMQRDLSDSTVIRNIGTAFSHSYLAITETIKGLNKLNINEKKCINDLENSPELLAEPIQTILKTAGINDPYELLKKFTRGKKIKKNELIQFVESLNVQKEILNQIKELKISSYIGYAVRICEDVLRIYEKEL